MATRIESPRRCRAAGIFVAPAASLRETKARACQHMSQLEFIIDKQSDILRVDGEIVVRRCCIDCEELAKSALQTGDYFIFTGLFRTPSEAGIAEPVRVEHENRKIHWHITDLEPGLFFSFDDWQYRLAVFEGLKRILAMRAHEIEGRPCLDYPSKYTIKQYIGRLQKHIPPLHSLSQS
jgi:hypothetical protein